ncbi:hypothetical protein [Mesorhizobium sangaii]|uniref:hypothetical protein n=1 Tax=Mesorhizobium sangaii TaxID=505389 RepID=UPI0016099E91|nr:hypothetical protein [Mesorhizobium sangaii]
MVQRHRENAEQHEGTGHFESPPLPTQPLTVVDGVPYQFEDEAPYGPGEQAHARPLCHFSPVESPVFNKVKQEEIQRKAADHPEAAGYGRYHRNGYRKFRFKLGSGAGTMESLCC